ncbi:MAG TPA: Zn-dependent hydrolase [Capillimicrobium sp.]|jgi:N-carbamoyl-L-amino-acid hydrolase
MGPDALLDTLDAARVQRDLDRLAELTGDAAGAQRVAWTDGWRRARAYVDERLDGVARRHRDPAGNVWYTVDGARPEALVLGSHVDSVPDGGAFDGPLGLFAGAAILDALHGTTPPMTVRLVDWADEEGARFGRSCFGSSAAAGTLDPDAVRDLRDADGVALPDALAAHDVDLDAAPRAGAELETARAYLELHIEQGPVLERRGEPVGVVTGTLGVERHRYRFAGRSSHAGTTPMDTRADAFLAAAQTALAARDAAVRHGGVATTGPVAVHPGVATIINELATITVDLRALEPGALAAMDAEVQAAAAGDDRVAVTREAVLRTPPVAFDAELVALAADACREVAGADVHLPSGALHDATEVGRRLPAVMLFARSAGGISHHRSEHTTPADVATATRALAVLAARALARPSDPSTPEASP